MILFISNSGESLPIAFRMQEEGTDVRVYIHSSDYKNNYDNIVDKVKIGGLKKAIQEAELVIFDTIGINEKTKNDLALLKMFGLSMASDSVFGVLADKLKKDCNVIGATAGIKEIQPELIGLKASKKKVEGVEIVVEGWFDGEEFVFYNYVFENKNFLTGNLGLELRSQTNLVWIQPDTFLQKNFEKLVPFLKEVGYKGVTSINMIISNKNKKPYFLGLKPGFRFDSLYCLLSLVEDTVTDFFRNTFNIGLSSDYAASERITIPPFPYSEKSLLDDFAKDVEIDTDIDKALFLWAADVKRKDERFVVVGSDGIVGIVAFTGKTIRAAFGNVFKSIKKLKVNAPLQYRVDGIKQMEKKINKLEAWGCKLSPH